MEHPEGYLQVRRKSGGFSQFLVLFEGTSLGVVRLSLFPRRPGLFRAGIRFGVSAASPLLLQAQCYRNVQSFHQFVPFGMGQIVS